jgi:NADPH:quinone reductase-like Zn-dependent oxidoreductase
MRAAGIRGAGGSVELLELPEPRALEADEVLIRVKAAGAASWDEIVRTGGWDVGGSLPMALGVEAAGTVVAAGDGANGWSVGDEVLTHPLQLREQGAWAEQMIVPALLLARKPGGVAWEVAGAFPVPALTAEQVLSEALAVKEGESLLVHGAGGVTGGLLVQLAALRGAHVIATAGPGSIERVRALGAHEVLDYNDAGWPARVRELTGGAGVDAAANAARGGAADAIGAVADGGRLATITGAPPEEARGIAISDVYVRPDAPQLEALAKLLGEGRLTLQVGRTVSLEEADAGLAAAIDGSAGGAVVVVP